MAKYKRHIDWHSTPVQSKIIQIYNKGLEYALVSDDYEQCHEFVWCKDFLQDVIYATVNSKNFYLYKFFYCPEKHPKPSLKKTRILLANSKDKKFADKIPAVLDFINQIEDHLGMSRTTARECKNPPAAYSKTGVYLFEGSSRWLKAPAMLSMYTLLLRTGFAHNFKNFETTISEIMSKKTTAYQRRDSSWLKNSEKGLNLILKKGDKKIFKKSLMFNYPEKMPVDQIHNKLGIVGFSNYVRNFEKGKVEFFPL